MNIMGFTTIPVKPATLRRLKGYKVGGATYDDLLNDFMDEQPPEAFLQEHLRRLREEDRFDLADVKRDLRR